MKMEEMIIVSVDDHVVEPPDMFDQHLPQSLKDKAPRVETNENGVNAWVFDDRKVINIGLNAVAGRPPEEYGCEPAAFTQVRKATYDIHARVDDMNANGLLGSLCFGTFISFDGSFFLPSKDKKTALAMVQAYNDWHIDEWCGAYPGRFIPLGILPLWDINLIVEEVRRLVKKGCRAITFPDNPTVKELPSIHNEYWEPLWKLCNEEKVVINCHIGTGYAPPHPSMESPINAWITGMPISIANSAADWIYLKALQRYPNLKVALTEGGIGWVPYLLERADFAQQHHHAWTHTDFGGKRPSDIFREHFITCFIDDKFGVKNRHDIGIDNICYECDYPHSDTVWPRTPEVLMESFGGVPDEDINKMTHLNAMREFSYDPFAILGRENCTVGALRQQAAHVDTSPQAMGGERPVAADETRVVTSGDVVKLFMANKGKDAEAA